MPSPRLAALAALTMLAACAHAAPGAVFPLTEHQSATVAPGAVLTYDSVNDSRCPPDVHCVVAGKVVYSFTLKMKATLEHFTLAPGAPAYVSPLLQGRQIALADSPPPPKARNAAAAHPVSVMIVAP